MKISCIIVDDEEEARGGLSLLLQQDRDLNVVSICSDGIQAISQINELKPDLVLLDIQMPEANGFEVLNSISYQPKAVIFITAHDQFALKAFEVHALDYLLKPFSDERFFEALNHAKDKIGAVSLTPKVQSAPGYISDVVSQQKNHDQVIGGTDSDKLVIKSDGRVHFLDFSEIIWVEAYDYYIRLHTISAAYLVRDSMKNMAMRLNPSFARVHRSSIVNVNFIKIMQTKSNNELILTLTNGTELKVSRSYKSELIEVIEKYKQS